MKNLPDPSDGKVQHRYPEPPDETLRVPEVPEYLGRSGAMPPFLLGICGDAIVAEAWSGFWQLVEAVPDERPAFLVLRAAERLFRISVEEINE